MNLTGIDHLVVGVSDIDETCALYEQLGAEQVTFGDGRAALLIGDQKINLHGPKTDGDLKPAAPRSDSSACCVLTERLITEVSAALATTDADIIAEPIQQSGARGPMISVYVRDPDENLVERATDDD